MSEGNEGRHFVPDGWHTVSNYLRRGICNEGAEIPARAM
jgi:hypothetical protein